MGWRLPTRPGGVGKVGLIQITEKRESESLWPGVSSGREQETLILQPSGLVAQLFWKLRLWKGTEESQGSKGKPRSCEAFIVPASLTDPYSFAHLPASALFFFFDAPH